jgi:hypothetical protein
MTKALLGLIIAACGLIASAFTKGDIYTVICVFVASVGGVLMLIQADEDSRM